MNMKRLANTYNDNLKGLSMSLDSKELFNTNLILIISDFIAKIFKNIAIP